MQINEDIKGLKVTIEIQKNNPALWAPGAPIGLIEDLRDELRILHAAIDLIKMVQPSRPAPTRKA